MPATWAVPATTQAAFFTIDLAVPPPLNFGCVLNLATLQPGPGITAAEMVTVEGYGLGPQPAVTFAGVAGTVVFTGAAPGLVAGVEQINVQLPASLPAGTDLSAVPVIVNAGLGDSAPVVYVSVTQ